MDTQAITLEKLQQFAPFACIDLKTQINRNAFDITNTPPEDQVFPTLAWSHSNEASNDFRSDFFTKPTLRMLEAIIHASLGDGDMNEDPSTSSFNEYVAGLVGHEGALLVMSGTMGNQVALRSALTSPPHSILADYRGHIINWEGGGAAALCGALIRMVVPSNGHHVTLDDVKKHCTLTDTYYDAPTRVISLENTLWGTVMPLSDIRSISQWARSQDPPIHMHLDGARLWEAAAAGACTLREIGECFDSIQLCFTKGLGAPIGSIITGNKAFIKRAVWSRKHLGGSTRASGIIAAPAKVAIEDVFFGGKLKGAQDKAKVASALWEQLGGKLQLPTETNLLWLDLEASGVTLGVFNDMAAKFNVKVGEPVHGRLAFHYQITDEAFSRLCEFFRDVLKSRGTHTLENSRSE